MKKYYLLIFIVIFVFYILFQFSKTEIVKVPIHRELDSKLYKTLEVDTFYIPAMDYKEITYRKRILGL